MSAKCDAEVAKVSMRRKAAIRRRAESIQTKPKTDDDDALKSTVTVTHRANSTKAVTNGEGKCCQEHVNYVKRQVEQLSKKQHPDGQNAPLPRIKVSELKKKFEQKEEVVTPTSCSHDKIQVLRASVKGARLSVNLDGSVQKYLKAFQTPDISSSSTFVPKSAKTDLLGSQQNFDKPFRDEGSTKRQCSYLSLQPDVIRPISDSICPKPNNTEPVLFTVESSRTSEHNKQELDLDRNDSEFNNGANDFDNPRVPADALHEESDIYSNIEYRCDLLVPDNNNDEYQNISQLREIENENQNCDAQVHSRAALDSSTRLEQDNCNDGEFTLTSPVITSTDASSALTSGVSLNNDSCDIVSGFAQSCDVRNIPSIDPATADDDDSWSGDNDSEFSNDSSTIDEGDDWFIVPEDEYANCQSLSRSQSLVLGSSSFNLAEIQSEPGDKLSRVIAELVSTEINYVQKLHLIDQEFQQVLLLRNQKEELIPNEVVPQIFSNINSIYEFHKNFLLPKLQQCRVPTAGGQDLRVGNELKQLAPFFKMYAVYLSNFTEANITLELWKTQRPKFAKFIQEVEIILDGHRLDKPPRAIMAIQSSGQFLVTTWFGQNSDEKPSCNKLGLQHHMLEPVQRVPRYELLLKDYLKYLPEDSPDKADAEKALELVTTAAIHSNEVMKTMDRKKKLFEVCQSIAGSEDIFTSTRQLVKEGRITTISKSDGKQKERHFFLFNDLLLICKYIPLSLKQNYKISAKLDIYGLKVCQSGSASNTFYLMSKEHVIEVCPCSAEEKEAWQSALTSVIDGFAEMNLSKFAKAGTRQKPSLGKVAPLWIKDHNAINCMLCNSEFNNLFNWRHHCRACGSVICGPCSAHRIPLAYNGFQDSRVCDGCYKKLGASLQMNSCDPSIICGYLFESRDKVTWNQQWFALRDDCILFSFKDKTEDISTTSLVVGGYRVTRLYDEYCAFSLTMSKPGNRPTHIYFRTDNEEELTRWMKVLEVRLNEGESMITAPTSKSSPAVLAQQLMKLAT